MEITSVRAEIKSWERAFRADRGRDPTIQDIKENPAIAEKYKLHKKLLKQCNGPSIPIVKKRPSEATEPSTPPRAAAKATKPRAPIFPKARPIQSFDEPSPSNPFSPTKRSAARQLSFTRNGHSADVIETRSKQEQRSFSPEDPFSSPSDMPANKAKRRLHGDPVSPSPIRHEKKRRLQSPASRPGKGIFSPEVQKEAIDVSFVDESPVKATGGKNFKLLFEERSDSASSTATTTRPAFKTLFPVFKKALPRTSSQPTEAQTIASSRTGLYEHRPNAQPAAGLETSKSVTAPRKRPSESVEDGANSIVSNTFNGLLPPSPRQSNSIQKGKSASWVRKKAKLNVKQEISDEEDSSQEEAIIFFEHSPRKSARVNTGAANKDGEDEILSRDPVYVSYNHAYGDIETGVDLLDQEDEERVDVDLPESLKDILHISSSRSCDRGERALVEDLLKGRPSGNEFGEVWGVGEMDDERNALTDGDDDWAGEGVPWEAGEL